MELIFFPPNTISGYYRLRKLEQAEEEKRQQKLQFKPNLQESAPLPKRSPADVLQRRLMAAENGQRDYITDNIRDVNAVARKGVSSAAAVGGRKAPPDSSEYLQKSDYGRVPLYIRERQIELAAQRARQQHADDLANQHIPPGMRLLEETERRETLQLLEEDRVQVEREINRLPFRLDTPSVIKHKADLEDRLREIDDAVRMFSRNRVLVRAA